MNLNQKITFSETVFAQEVDGEMVLLDMNSENYFGLDEVGTSIWQAMQESGSLDEVYQEMLKQYEVEPEVLQKDLLDFAQKLSDSGLAEIK
ncbi:MAG: PqqD family protein [Campylobacterota bacterium]|nr:PqqD family protein [Campylobacterota bacterium]